MANKYQGEAEILRPDGGKTVVLRIGARAICKAEVALGKSLNEMLTDLQAARLTTLVALMRCAVVGSVMSEEQACDLVDEVGYQAVGTALTKAMIGALGIEDEKKGEGNGNPTDTAIA